MTLRQAMDYPDDFEINEGEVLKVTNQGVPNGLISPEALYNDTRAYWVMHERKLAVIMMFCVIYFLGVLL